MRKRPYIHFDKGVTGAKNVPGKGWYEFARPFVTVGITFTGWSRTLHLGEWKRPYRRVDHG